MSTTSKITVGATEYDLRDADAQEQLTQLKSDFDELEEAVENKANIDGSYDTLTAGNAEQLISTQVVEDKVPYLFRTSGGSADIGNRENDMIVGGSIVFNQQVIDGNFSDETHDWNAEGAASVSISDGVATVTSSTAASSVYNPALSFTKSGTTPRFQKAIIGHKYFIEIVAKYPVRSRIYFGSVSPINNTYLEADQWTDIQFIYEATAANLTPSGYLWAYLGCRDISELVSGESEIQFKRIRVHDLTAMFGSTIADYIYSLETATPGVGVAWFRHLFPKNYYDYDAGTLMHVSSLSSHDTVGLNAWDEQWELGSISSSTGKNVSGTTTIRSKNYIPVVPNAKYYYRVSDYTTSSNIAVRYYDADKNFIGVNDADGLGGGAGQVRTMPSNACYIRFYIPSAAEYGTTYKNDICINLSWSGTHNGEYEPYKKNSYPLDDSLTLRGVPKLDAENNLYYDGDTYEADGTVTRRYGIVDLGTLTDSGDTGWKYIANDGDPYFRVYLTGKKTGLALICSDYAINPTTGTNNLQDKHIGASGSDVRLYLRDSAYTSLESFLTAMSGVMLVYELATPTTETAEPYQDPQVVDDWGTEEYVSTSLVPVGHDTKYPANLRDKLQHLPDLADSDGYYAIKQVGTQMSLELFRIPKAPTEDGTYTLKATVTSGTPVYTWEEVTE